MLLYLVTSMTDSGKLPVTLRRLDEDDTGYISKKNLKKLLGSGYQVVDGLVYILMLYTT